MLNTPPSDATSFDLLQRAVAGDPQAWADLVQQYSRLVRFWCHKAELPPDDIDDVAQEVFRAVHANLAKFERRSDGAFRRWLYTITQSKLADYFRRAERQFAAQGGSDAWHSLAQVADPLGLSGSSSSQSGPSLGAAIVACEAVRKRVTEATWEAFLAVVVENQPAQAVAAELGMTVNAVYIAKARCLKLLREAAAVPDLPEGQT